MVNQADKVWELQCYGMTKESLDRMIKTQAFPGQEMMFAAGLLSDAQELLSAEWNPDGVGPKTADRARQLMNCAKYIMFNTMKETA